jgi:hypothetical protein
VKQVQRGGEKGRCSCIMVPHRVSPEHVAHVFLNCERQVTIEQVLFLAIQRTVHSVCSTPSHCLERLACESMVNVFKETPVYSILPKLPSLDSWTRRYFMDKINLQVEDCTELYICV